MRPCGLFVKVQGCLPERLSAFHPYPRKPARILPTFLAHSVGLGVNAGHDLSLENLEYFHSQVPFLNEVSIGHSLIADALYYGLHDTIRRYKDCLK